MTDSNYDQYDWLGETDVATLVERCRAAEEACEDALPFLRRLVKLERVIIDSRDVAVEDVDAPLVAAGRKVREVVENRAQGQNVPPA